jgi:hypothetical protein
MISIVLICFLSISWGLKRLLWKNWLSTMWISVPTNWADLQSDVRGKTGVQGWSTARNGAPSIQTWLRNANVMPMFYGRIK